MSLFDGYGLDPEEDDPRLSKQLVRVYNLMSDGAWRTLSQISAGADAPEASVSARLRDFRKPRFGGHEVEERRVGGKGGLHEYRLIPNEVGLLDGTGVPDDATVWREYGGVWCVVHRDIHRGRWSPAGGCGPPNWRNVRIRCTRREL